MGDPIQQDQTTQPGPSLITPPGLPPGLDMSKAVPYQAPAQPAQSAQPAVVPPAGLPAGLDMSKAVPYVPHGAAGGGTLEGGLKSFIDAQDRPLQEAWRQGGVLGTAGGLVGSAAFGAEKSALRTLWDVGGLGQKAWNSTVGSADPNAKISTFDDDPEFLQSHGITESVGAGAEQIAEFLLGETALKAGVEGAKGLSVAQKLSKAAKEMELVENNPRLATALRFGIGALRSGAQAGTVGAGLSLLHGASAGQALKSGALTGAIGFGLGLPSAAAANPEAILDTFNLPKTIANTRLASQVASTLQFSAGAAFTVPQGFNALMGQQEGETPQESEQRRGEAAVQAALGFWAMKDALSEGNDLSKAAAKRQGETPGETDILRTRFPISSSKDQREEVTEAWGHASPYLAREAQGQKWKTNPWKFWQDKTGEVDRAANVAEAAKWKLRDSQIVPVETDPNIKDTEGDVSPVAKVIRDSAANEDPDSEFGKKRIEGAAKYAAKFEGSKLTVTQLSDEVKKLTDDRKVSGWFAKDDATRAQLLNNDPILEEKVKALGALREVLIKTISDNGGETVGAAYRKARIDFGYLSEVQHMLEGDVRSPTKSGIVEKMANIVRFYNFPKSTIHGNLMGEFRNPDRTVAQAFRDVGKFVSPAGEAVRPTIQTSMLDATGPDFSGKQGGLTPAAGFGGGSGGAKTSTTEGFAPATVGGENLEGRQAVVDPGQLHAMVYDAIQNGDRFQLTPDQTRVWYQNFKEHPWPDQEAGPPEQQLLNPLTAGHAPVEAQISAPEDADRLRAKFLYAQKRVQDDPSAANLRSLADIRERLEKPAGKESLFGQTPTPVSPLEWSDERLRKVNEALDGWIDVRKQAQTVLDDTTATGPAKDKARQAIEDAITKMFKGVLPPDKAAEVKTPPTAAEANASLQDVIDHLEAKIDAARSAAKSAAPEEKTEKNKLLNKAVQELIKVQTARDSLTEPKEGGPKSPKGSPVGPKAATGAVIAGVTALGAAKAQAQTKDSLPDGMAAVGNIDLNHRPVIQNKDGSHSTIFSWTVPIGNGQWALVPSIADGKFLTPDGKMPDMTDQKQRTALYNAALAQYKKTGQHLGIFKSEDAANKFAEATHDWMPTGSKEKVFLPKPHPS